MEIKDSGQPAVNLTQNKDLNSKIDEIMSSHNEIKILVLAGITETDNNPKVFTSIKIQESEIDNNIPDLRTETGLSLKDVLVVLKFTDKGYIQELVSKFIELSQYFLNIQLSSVQEACKVALQTNSNEDEVTNVINNINNKSKAEN